MLLLSYHFCVHDVTCSDLVLPFLPLLKVLSGLTTFYKQMSSLSSLSLCSPHESALFLLTMPLLSAQHSVLSVSTCHIVPVSVHILFRKPFLTVFPSLHSFCVFMIFTYWFVCIFIDYICVYIIYVCKNSVIHSREFNCCFDVFLIDFFSFFSL